MKGLISRVAFARVLPALLAVLCLASSAMAQVDPWVPPDIGFDGESVATGAGTALGAVLVVIIGLAVAFTMGRKFITWFRSYVK